MQGIEISSENKFISSYMILRKIETDALKNRYLAEDMRSNKEVWIDEYFKQIYIDAKFGQEKQNIFHVVSEVKKIDPAQIVHIYEVIERDEIIYVITAIPRGMRAKSLEKYNEKTVFEVGDCLVKALLVLKRRGISIDYLRPEDIYIDSQKEIQLLFGDSVSLQQNQSSSDKGVKSIGEFLCFYILGELPNGVDDAKEKLKIHCSDILTNLIIHMLSEGDEKFQRLEEIAPLLEQKRVVGVNEVDLSDDEVSVSDKVYRSLLVLLAVVFIYTYVYHPKSFVLKEISTFDKARFHLLGYIGIEEAQQILGEIYEKGYGVKKDYQISIQWYEKAAQSGNVYAQMSLGHFYDKGIGVRADRKQALYWFALAATNGDEVAKHNVEILQDNLKITVLASNGPKMEAISILENNVSNDTVIKMESESKKEPIVVKTEEVASVIPELIREKKAVNNRVMWQDTEDNVKLKLTWNEAMSYCLDLKLNGYDDWYLPDKETLFQLFFEQRDLNYHLEDLYWSSTQESDLTAWRVYFDYTGGKNRLSLTSKSKNDRWNVRCYRKVQ